MSDPRGSLREAAFAHLVRRRRPIAVVTLARWLELPLSTAERLVASLAAGGWLDLNAVGHVTGACGLALDQAATHRISLGRHMFSTWCAYDGIAIAAALRADAVFHTACGRCAQPLTVAFSEGSPTKDDSAVLWLAHRGQDLRDSFCAPTVLLCGQGHAREWCSSHGGRGELLSIAEASRRGAIEWQGCARASAALI